MPAGPRRRKASSMAKATIDRPRGLKHEEPQLRDQLARLHAENERLHVENRDLRLALDSHVSRARSTALFGPLEMTAGTCVGPRGPRVTDRATSRS